MKVQKSLAVFIFYVIFSLAAAGCNERDQEMVVDLVSQIIVSEIKEIVNEAIEMLPIPKKPEMSDVLPSVIEITMPEISFGDLMQPALFGMPTTGYMGMKYLEPYPPGSMYYGKLHSGIDIWASQKADNGGKRGNPVYSVYEGDLYRTGDGVRIIHPELDRSILKNLPDYSVSTKYGHLIDMPEKIKRLPKGCPGQSIYVKQGDLLGYMDPKLTPENGYVVHLHFSITDWKIMGKDTVCWASEWDTEKRYDPFIYLGLNANDYSNEMGKRSEFPISSFSLNTSDILIEIADSLQD